jgi:hypothetical protein
VTKPPVSWPSFEREAGRFFSTHLGPPRALFNAFLAKGSGSGRREGPRHLYWQTVAVFAFASLEAGLEDLLFAAHGARQGSEGKPIAAGSNSPDRNPRDWLVSKRLQNPNPQAVSRLLFQDFGVVMGALPPIARFEVRRKMWSKGGSGQGDPAPGPSEWKELSPYLDALSYIRHATAHGDPEKLHEEKPRSCEGALWLQLQNGRWSVQQPHALTALRTAVSVYNTVAVELATSLGVVVPKGLVSPDTIRSPAKPKKKGGAPA